MFPKDTQKMVDIFAVDPTTGNTHLQEYVGTKLIPSITIWHSRFLQGTAIPLNVLAFLLENKIGLNVQNKMGDTAAHILMRKGKPRLWRHLGCWGNTAGLSNYVRRLFPPLRAFTQHHGSTLRC